VFYLYLVSFLIPSKKTWNVASINADFNSRKVLPLRNASLFEI
jgi:hypothetical protein